MSQFRIYGKGWLGEGTLWSIQLGAESRFSELVSTALWSKTVKGRVVSSAHFYLSSIKYTSMCSFTSLLHSYLLLQIWVPIRLFYKLLVQFQISAFLNLPFSLWRQTIVLSPWQKTNERNGVYKDTKENNFGAN